jgi:hypothetical protein
MISSGSAVGVPGIHNTLEPQYVLTLAACRRESHSRQESLELPVSSGKRWRWHDGRRPCRSDLPRPPSSQSCAVHLAA